MNVLPGLGLPNLRAVLDRFYAEAMKLMSKTLLFVALFGMLAYLTQTFLPFLFFSSLILVVTLGRSVPVGIVCAVLFGACFPKLALAAALAMTYYVMTLSAPPASTPH